MIYERLFFPQAKKELEKLDKSIKIQIIKKLRELDVNPELGKPLTNFLKNTRSLHIGDYRVIYSIKEEYKKIIIIKVGHRRNVYSLFGYFDIDKDSNFSNLLKSTKKQIYYKQLSEKQKELILKKLKKQESEIIKHSDIKYNIKKEKKK
jgi:mRNA interferase RelE/StbE